MSLIPRSVAAMALGLALIGTGTTAASAQSLLALQSKAEMSGGAVRVIVEFAQPEVKFVPGLSGPAAERASIGAVRGRQAEILASALGVDPALTRAGKGRAKLMDHAPMMALAADSAELAKLAADPRVVRIVEDGISRPSLNQSRTIIGMLGTKGAYKRGADGRGRAVAILDTGVNGKHEFLLNKVIFEACFGTEWAPHDAHSLCPGGAASATGPGSGADCQKIAGCGHGTHVAGTAAGRNSGRSGGEPVSGVARNAGVVAIQVFSRIDDEALCGGGSCIGAYDSDVIKALELVYSLKDGVAGRKIDAVNLSLGGGKSRGFCNNHMTAPIITKLRDAGIATVIAAGNDFRTDAVGFPACVGNAITVGATTKRAPGRPDRVASYSNIGGPVDVLAPGGDSTYPRNGQSGMILASYRGGYARLNGTSMAAPHVAGAIAAIRSRPACATKTVAEIENAFRNSGPTISDHRKNGKHARRRLSVPGAMKKLGCW